MASLLALPRCLLTFTRQHGQVRAGADHPTIRLSDYQRGYHPSSICSLLKQQLHLSDLSTTLTFALVFAKPFSGPYLRAVHHIVPAILLYTYALHQYLQTKPPPSPFWRCAPWTGALLNQTRPSSCTPTLFSPQDSHNSNPPKMSLSREQLLFAEVAKAMKKTVARQAIGMSICFGVPQQADR